MKYKDLDKQIMMFKTKVHQELAKTLPHLPVMTAVKMIMSPGVRQAEPLSIYWNKIRVRRSLLAVVYLLANLLN